VEHQDSQRSVETIRRSDNGQSTTLWLMATMLGFSLPATWKLAVFWLAMLPLAFSPSPVVAEDLESSLRQLGLEPHGREWVLPRELTLRRNLQALDEIRQRVVLLKKQIETAEVTNLELWREQQQALRIIDQIAVSMRRSAVGSEEEKRVQQQIDKLKKASREMSDAVAPDQLGGHPQVRPLLVSLTLQLQNASLLTRQIREDQQFVEGFYRGLDKHRDASEVARLSPLTRKEYVHSKLEKIESELRLLEVPVFLHADQARLGVVLNNDFPVLVSVLPQDTRLVITSNMAMAAGIDPVGDIESIEVAAVGKKKARRAKLNVLAFGSVKATDISIFVLEPEHESTGAYLGLRLFQSWNPKFIRSGTTLVLDPKSHASTASN